MNTINVPLFNGKPMKLEWGSHEINSSGFISWGYGFKFKFIYISVYKGWDNEDVYFWSVGFGGYEPYFNGEALTPQEAADKAYECLVAIREDIHDMIK